MAARTDSFSSDGTVYLSRPADTHVIEADITDRLPEAFTDLWRSEKLCDMTLSCGGDEFKVHSLVLYAYSPYFADLIDKAPQQHKVTVHCDADLVRLCLQFIYCGRVEVTTGNLEMLTEAAKLFCIKHLYRKCKEIQFKDITKENCLEALCFLGEREGEKDMKTNCLQLAVTVFEEICETEGFMNLCSKCVTVLVTHENLAVSSPGDRLSAAFAWLEHGASKRVAHVVPFLHKLPLRTMSKAEMKFALRSPVVQNNEQAARIINDALNQRKTAAKSLAESEERKDSDVAKAECLVSMAALDVKFNTTGKEVLVTPLSFTGKWHKLTDLPADPRRFNAGVGCVAHGSSLYVTGLGKSSNEAWVFTISSGSWKRLSDLQNSRVSHCMAHYDGGIYVLGGHEASTIESKVSQKPVHRVEVLHSGRSEWQRAGDLEGKRCHNSCSTVTDDGILVHGSYDGDTNLLQLYKPKQKVTELFVKYQREKFVDVQGIVKTENHIILCGAEHVYVLSLSSVYTDRQDTQQSAFDLPRYNMSVHLSGDGKFIYAVGGKDRYDDKHYEHYIHRASVKDVINNTGSGWQGVKMNWPTSQQNFYPGAHCTATIQLKDLAPV